MCSQNTKSFPADLWVHTQAIVCTSDQKAFICSCVSQPSNSLSNSLFCKWMIIGHFDVRDWDVMVISFMFDKIANGLPCSKLFRRGITHHNHW